MGPSSFILSRAVQPLALRIEYVYGETLSSYVDRLAKLHGTTLRAMLIRLGVVEEGRWSNPVAYGVTLSEAAHKRFSLVSGLSQLQVTDLLLVRYAGTIIKFPERATNVREFARKAAFSEWAYFTGSHFCPDCLRESGGVWFSHWKLPWSFACVRHGLLLNHICPECGRRPRAGTTSGIVPAFYEKISEPTRCNNSRLPIEGLKRGPGNPNSRPCGCSFIDLRGLKASNTTLDAQRSINQKLAEALEASKSNERVAAARFFSEMRSVCALILFASEVEDFDFVQAELFEAFDAYVHHRRRIVDEEAPTPTGRGRLKAMSGIPTSATLMAAIAERALAIVCSTSPELLRQDMCLLADRVYSHPRSRKWATSKIFRLPPRIQVEFDSCMAVHGAFDRRCGAHSAMSAADGPLLYHACNVPQLMPSEDYVARFRRFFQNHLDKIGQQTCSIAAVKMLGCTWSQASAALELPPSAARTAENTITVLRRNGQFDGFARQLRAWATELSRSSYRVNYQMRRAALRSVTDFDVSHWKELCRVGAISPGYPGGRSRFAAAWMWADATSGDWHLSPALQSRNLCSISSQYKIMMKLILPAMEQALRAEADARIESYQSRLPSARA